MQVLFLFSILENSKYIFQPLILIYIISHNINRFKNAQINNILLQHSYKDEALYSVSDYVSNSSIFIIIACSKFEIFTKSTNIIRNYRYSTIRLRNFQ